MTNAERIVLAKKQYQWILDTLHSISLPAPTVGRNQDAILSAHRILAELLKSMDNEIEIYKKSQKGFLKGEKDNESTI